MIEMDKINTYNVQRTSLHHENRRELVSLKLHVLKIIRLNPI